MEAMASGCPVITSSTSACPEIAGDAALFVNPNDPREISEAIDKLGMDEALRERLTQAGLKQAEKFQWKDSALKTIELFKQVLIADGRAGHTAPRRRASKGREHV